MSVTERDYRHSIVIVDLLGGAATTEVVEIPRTAEFLAVPVDGARPIGDVERLLGQLELDAELPPGRTPFLEVSVLLDRAEPGINARVREALNGKAMEGLRDHDSVALLIDSIRAGRPVAVGADQVEFYNSLQAFHAHRFVIDPDGKFEVAAMVARDRKRHP